LNVPKVTIEVGEGYSGTYLNDSRIDTLRASGQFYGEFSLAKLQGSTTTKKTVVDLRGCVFDSACVVDLRDANLIEADLRGITFYAARTKFKGVQLKDANMEGCRIVGNLRNVDLSEVDLSGVDLTDATWDDTVKLPPTYDPKFETSEVYRKMVLSGALSPQQAKEFYQDTYGDASGRSRRHVDLDEAEEDEFTRRREADEPLYDVEDQIFSQPVEDVSEEVETEDEDEEDVLSSEAEEVYLNVTEDPEFSGVDADLITKVFYEVFDAFDGVVNEENKDAFEEAFRTAIQAKMRKNKSRRNRF
jgi:hypothetical protein